MLSVHTIAISDNAEAGLDYEAKRRSSLRGESISIDDVLTNEMEGLGLSSYQQSVQEEANAVTNAFLAANTDAQSQFRDQVIPLAVSILGMEISKE